MTEIPDQDKLLATPRFKHIRKFFEVKKNRRMFYASLYDATTGGLKAKAILVRYSDHKRFKFIRTANLKDQTEGSIIYLMIGLIDGLVFDMFESEARAQFPELMEALSMIDCILLMKSPNV